MKTTTLKFIIAIMLLSGLNFSYTFAQNIKNWEWANSIVGTNKNHSYSLITDKEGNNYVAGSFSDTLKAGKTIMTSKGSFDIYILKYNAKGSLIWAKQAGGKDYDEAYGLALDESGNIYITGYFSGSANFAGIKLQSNGDRDFFAAKYDQNGEPVWVKQGSGTVEDYGTAIATDKTGNIFITGIFKGAISIGNSKYISKGDKDIFIIKYRNNGEIIWSTTGGGSMEDVSTSMATDHMGNCYIAGNFEGTAEFNKKSIVCADKKGTFLAKYNSDGSIQWLKRTGSATVNIQAASIASDALDNIYATGYFSGVAHFGKSELKNMDSDDLFLIKYDANGDEIWAKQTGGKGDEHATALKLDKNGNIYLTGEYNLEFNFGESNLRNLGDWDIFILKYSNSGEMLDVAQISGTGYDKAYGIGLDDLSNIYVVGYFSKTVSIGATNLSSIDADDSFIAKLKGF